MTQREKTLAAAVVVLIAAYGGWYGWQWWRSALANRASDLQAAEVGLAEARLRESQARASLRRLEALRERSLPNDIETAPSEYRDWLVEQFDDSGMQLDKLLRTGAPVDRGGAYTTMSFKAQADGKIRDVASFLYLFYDCPATHKVTQLKLTPLSEGGVLRVDLDIEAIIVGGASRKSGIPAGPSGRLQKSSIGDYLTSIEGRSLFAEYVPPRPPPPPRVERSVARSEPPPPPPPFDHSTQARFTGAVGSGDSMQAWVLVLTTGETFRLSAGDELKVGLLAGRVVTVSARELVYEAGDDRYRVSLGEFLRDGSVVPTEPVL